MAKVLIAETSYLVRKGLVSLLEQTDGVTELKAAGHPDTIVQTLKEFSPDIILLNSAIQMPVTHDKLLSLLHDKARFIYIINTPLPEDSPANHISVFDTKNKLTEKLSHHLRQYESAEEKEETEELTPREKLILKHVALGYTNKEIATKLFISTHTVISHRKNITRKLDIKTVSGLTVYSLINGIIKMEDIQ
ncbi:response regulator transcription factor [Marinilabilia salmonicolor]|jgi:DNA-binding NarL/FixJ family response regulator|uniref:Transcriptional regulator n=1 Tax=Marinilabilia salmonicolor TaxID=989 RepID=A0A2T0WQ52_9BACT|nr:LuxR C-terminal-related transcriptional regulator [Marinilabilia salmonicolor]PRY88654.1 transcriptional regulator [Marinilabilia salmonicolor]RCW25748.1 transcriptional regulator [Marinilabilia salmonicolor]